MKKNSEAAWGVRFAPSPTGRLHLGNLRSAWISYEISRVLGQPWIVRFEDIDGPRVVSGAQELQLKDLQLVTGADSTRIEVHLQSQRADRHFEMFSKARAQLHVYPCDCSRKEISQALHESSSAPHSKVVRYTGACRDKDPSRKFRADLLTLAWRFRSSTDTSGAGDFIVARSSQSTPTKFAPSYNWACALDDWEGRYSWIVRAYDLAEVLNEQRALCALFDSLDKKSTALASVFHCALVTNVDGSRLEKRTQGVTLPELDERGVGVETLRSAFAQSFALPPQWRALTQGSVTGESREALSISDLLSRVSRSR